VTSNAVRAILATVPVLSTKRRARQMLNEHSNNPTQSPSTVPALGESALVSGEAIGTVTQVGGTTVTISVATDLSSPIRVGDLLGIVSGPTLFLSGVLHLETRDHITQASLSLLATVDLATLTLTQGVSRLPLPNSLTYRPSITVVKAHLETRR